MNLYFRSDKPKADGSIEVYHINRIQEVLGHEICSQLMFIHAMTGSDRTSRIFGVGKKTAFQNLRKETLSFGLVKSYTATARLPAKHRAALVEGMDYHVQLSVDRAKLKNVTIHRSGFSQRSRKMMMNKD